MNFRHQILSIGFAGAIMASMVGGVGLMGATRLAGAYESSVTMGLALRNSQSASMMLVAVKGDVQLALLGALGYDKAQVAEARKGIKQHADSYIASLTTLSSLPLSDEAKRVISQTQPLARKYTETATTIGDLTANGTPEAAAARTKGFQQQFVDLEKQMGQQSMLIESDVKAFSEVSSSAVHSAKTQVGVALVVSTLLVLLWSLWLANKLTRPMAHAVEVADNLAECDLTTTIRPHGNDETIKLLQAMAKMQNNLAYIVERVQTNAHRVANASAEIAQGNIELSNRTEQQASALEKTAGSMEELNSTIRVNSDNAVQANRFVVNASVVALKGGEVVGQVIATMKNINESSRKIADITSVIDGIAFQTNILALNAAVEAARAGEQGRGFAVVASEVRSLAGRSANAAREIKSLISASVERIEQGSALVDQAGLTMAEVVKSIQSATALMGGISAASSEQALGVSEVTEAIAHIDRVTQQNAAQVEEVAAAASNLKTQSSELVDTVAVFKLEYQHLG